jgi:hypothetical protein
MPNPFFQVDIRPVEEFVVWLHEQKYRLKNQDGETVSIIQTMEKYGKVLDEQQKEMDERVSRCEAEKVCLSCGEDGFPFCVRHDGNDPFQGMADDFHDHNGPRDDFPD